jgi:pilus assembly protein CpaF
MCTLPLLAGENVSDRFVVPTVASAIDIVVHLAVDARGRRRVTEIVAIPGRVESGVVELEQLFLNRGNGLQRAEGYPPHQERFARNGYRLTELLAA